MPVSVPSGSAPKTSKSSPCFACSPLTAALAYVSLGYAITSIVYLAITRCLGTPFKDTLSEMQREVLRKSKAARRKAFCIGVAVAALLLLLTRPLSSSVA
jgi:phosphatidylglycerophosphate synthase